MPSRRIALVGPLHPWRGGLAQYLGLLGEALKPHADVRAVTFTRQYPDFLFPGTSQFDPDAARPDFPTEAMLDSIGPLSWRRVAAHLERFAPAAVVLKWWMPFFAPAFASSVGPLRRKGTRVILVCDNLIPHEPRFYDAAFTDWMMRNSDGYLVMSDSVNRDLDTLKAGAPRRRVPHPFYAQFDRKRFDRDSARAKLGLSGDVAMFFGYVRHYKGLDTLLEAWPLVRVRRPGATLVVAGEFYEKPEPYHALVKAAGEGAVRMLDRYIPDDEVEALFRAADVTVLPYRSATQSGVTHVAYALGCPVIATNVGGITETVREGETGLTAPPENPQALADVIVRFFEQGMAPAMAPHIAKLQAEHSWEALADSTVSLIDELKPGRGWS
ncbi:MAG: glycosyltransferase [Candidatus Eisenbacteria bacterium]|uniref:Glycosyltransferase n=1 Tax=Eiseniibacteriota bacterium TaxID=2212470 RepID=A0A933SAM7_UNCEI|nr:glycosyltransferase [Candidatus Eisenbacteria bacterium]